MSGGGSGFGIDSKSDIGGETFGNIGGVYNSRTVVQKQGAWRLDDGRVLLGALVIVGAVVVAVSKKRGRR